MGSSKAPCLAVPKRTYLRDIVLERHVFGPTTVRGTLWPSGEAFAATLWAISGRPGGAPGAPIEQVVYTDRGACRTGMDLYGLVNAGVFDY